METKEEVLVKEKLVKLVDGEFTPDQAMEILRALINQKINYHKIENQQNWERNHNLDSEPFFKRIQELEEEKKAINQYISNLKKEGKTIEIKGVLTVKPVI